VGPNFDMEEVVVFFFFQRFDASPRDHKITQLMSCVHGPSSIFENKDSGWGNPTCFLPILKSGQKNKTHQPSDVMMALLWLS